jgi:hypothetical protein
LATCKLDLENPSFLAQTQKYRKKYRDFDKGLSQLAKKVEVNHQAAHWVNHQMPGYPKYTNRVWKYDWMPPSQNSSGRPCWRIYVIASDFSIDPVEAWRKPSLQPISITAVAAFPKSDRADYSLDELREILSPFSESAPL